MRGKIRWFGLLLVVLGLDQLTKSWASASLVFAQPISVFPGFNWTLLHNTGAAFSFLSDAGGWQRWFFLVIALIATIGGCVWMIRLPVHRRLLLASLALIVAGALANGIDRLMYGYVVDFIDLYYADYHWPAFNVADMAISLGAAGYILDAFREERTASKP